MSISESPGSGVQSRIAQWLSETLANGRSSRAGDPSRKKRSTRDRTEDDAAGDGNGSNPGALAPHDIPQIAFIAASDIRAGALATAAGESAAALQANDPSLPEPAVRQASNSGVLDTAAPSMSFTTSVAGSSTPATSQPAGLNVSPCCGSCGYVNCPLQAMAQAGTTKLAGESLGAGSPGVPDAVISRSGTIGASMSDPMLSQNVSSAGDWTLAPVIVSNGSLPGGGETGTGPSTKTVGFLSGSVTSPQVQVQARSLAATPNALAATATNPVVLENQKQGNPESEWGIDGAGSSNIEGFATDISVNHGNRINFKIDTDSNNYRIDIYRLGYYGGMGARKITTIQHTGVQNQPNPLRDATTGLVDAGNWAVSAGWDVPADAVSGVYIAKLVRQDGTFGENQIPFIVRDDSSHSDIVFQTSDETWQAYNGWGGANFYGGNGPATGQGAGRAYALSYNRPITTRGGPTTGTFAGPQDYLFGAEYAAISWLEQNGYDVSYMAGVDVDRFGSLLLNHQVYMDAGHDEYWSGQQRTNVEAARDAGVNLQFWSGNEVYWRTRWGNSISSDATAYRTMISYKETWSPGASIDPTNQWTGTFRDPRLSPPAIGGGNPENSLTGTLFKVDDVGTNLESIRVPYDDANLRFWRNTTVANLQPGQTATLTKNYLGYEWDEAPDNGFDPAGLVKLSSTTLPVSTYLLDYGNTTGNGTATHNLTLYRAPSGALVFGAGTVFWSWGVSDNHDLTPTPTDQRVQQAMVNLFADMGVQPGTLQSGLITGAPSTDTTAPTSTFTAPATASVGTTITISGTASDVGGVIAGVEVSTDNGASWHPATGDENWTYTFAPQVAGNYTIRSRAVDDSINLETPSSGRTVTVGAPNFVSLFPGTATPEVLNTLDDSAVELGVRFSSSVSGTISGIRFYKSSQDTGVHTGTLWSSTGAILGTLTFSNETASGWQTATFSSPITITAGTTYTASYHTNVGHYSNTENYFTANATSGPLTAPASNNGVFAYGSNSIFPTETFQATNFWVDVMFNPSSGGANQPPVAGDDPTIAVTLNMPLTISAATLLANDSDPNGDPLTITAATTTASSHGTVSLNTQNNTITFTPETGYTGTAGFSYTVSDGRGGTDTANVSLNVTTTPQPVSFFTSSNTPANTSLNDGRALEVGMKFTSSTAGQITALKFYRSASDTGPDLLSLWSSTGTKLASATFTNTGASGWQTVTLATPVNISANTTYIASYHTNGAYVVTNNFFTNTLTSGVLTAPSTSTSGGNGVYSYGGDNTNGIFPNSTFSGSNYWVDVVFNGSTSGGTNTAPTAVADTGDATERGGTANGTGGSSATGNVLSNDTDPNTGDTKTVSAVSFGSTTGTLGSALAGAFGSLMLNASGAFTYTVNENIAAVQALRQSTDTVTDVFSYTMRDAAGATSTATLTVTVHGANDAPVLLAQTGNQSAVVGSAFSFVLPAGTFADADTGDTLTYSATLADGSALPSWLAFNATTRTLSGTPATANVGTLSVRVTATDLGSLTASETFNIAVTTGTSSSTPPTAVADTGDATERGGTANGTAGSSATGNVLTNDTDPDAGDTKTVTTVSFGSTAGTLGTALNGARGSLTLNASGAFTYTVNESNTAVQALRQSTDTLTDVFNYTMRDTAGGTSSATLTITIHGANDAPVLAAQTANQNAVVGSAFSLVLPADTFTDVDTGDTIAYSVTLADGSALPSWLAFNATTRTFSGTPAAANVGTLTIRVTATDLGSLVATETFNIAVTTTTPPPTGVSLFSASNTPANTSVNDGRAVELGMKFTSSTDGQITALKFYRNAGDTGPDLLSLWTSTGTKLASATFSNTSASGWQTVTLSTPVNINANTTYIASYHTNGAYVVTNNFFTSAITSGSLTAPSTSTSGGNGVYTYGGNNTNGIFPTSTFSGSNYWVDVVFNGSTGGGGNNTTPTAVADTGDATERGGTANGSGGLAATGNVLTNDTDPDTGDTKAVTAVSFGSTTGTLGTALNGARGSLTLNASGAFTYNVNENDSAVQALRQSTNTLTDVFTYTMRDTAGATSTATLTVTIHGANDAPTLANQVSDQNAVVGSAYSLVLPANTFADVDTGDTLTYSATLADGSALPSWLAFNATTRTFSGTPAAANVGTLSIRATATDAGGLATNDTFNIAVTTTSTPSTVSLFSASNTPTNTNVNDGRALEVGMKFSSSTAGQITALKFYRSPGDTGSDLLSLWTSTGTKLASATFTNTSASGWQTVTLSTPVNINANTTYVASYHTNGAYVVSNNFFTTPLTSGPLTAPSSATSGGNGVYAYGGDGTSGLFPNSTFSASNYYADVVFRPQLAA